MHTRLRATYGASVGVSGLDGGSGISSKVGVAILNCRDKWIIPYLRRE